MRPICRGIAFSFVALSVLCGFQDKKQPQQPQPEILGPVKSFKSNYYEGKKLLLTLSSEEMTPIDKEHLRLVKPSATIYHDPQDKTQPVTKIDVTSLSGTFDIPGRVLHLTDSVVVVTSMGSRLETSALDLDAMKKLATTAEVFHYEEPGVVLTGKGFETNQEQKTLWVKHDLSGRINQEARQRASGADVKSDSSITEVLEFASADGMKRTPLAGPAVEARGATERYELTRDVHMVRTLKEDKIDVTDQLSAEYVEFFVRKVEGPGKKPQENKSEVTELHARDHVQLASSRGGTLVGDDLTWNQQNDVLNMVGKTPASGQWGKNTFAGNQIHFDRKQGILQCLGQASSRMEPEKAGQDPMTIQADHITATVVTSSGGDSAGEQTRLRDFVAEKDVTLMWSDPKGAPTSDGHEPSRAFGQRFDWNQTEGHGVLVDTPYARVVQAGNIIESPRMIIYNNPSRVILKGPKRLKVIQSAAEGNKEYLITSPGDMVMDPAEGHIRMLRDVTMSGTDVLLMSDSMVITLSKEGNQSIEALTATGTVQFQNRTQGVKLFGDQLTWDPKTSTTIVTGAPYAYVFSPGVNLQAGEVHYDEKTGQVEGRRGTMRSVVNVQEKKEQKKSEEQERRPE